MDKNIKILLEKNKTELERLAKHNAIEFIGLFGSVARGEDSNKSDIDLLVKFDFSKKSIGLFELYRIQKQLENVLGSEVDIVTKPNKFVKPSIDKDLVTIYERR